MFNKNETLATLTKREYIIIEVFKAMLGQPYPRNKDGQVVWEFVPTDENVIDSAITVSDSLISALEDEG